MIAFCVAVEESEGEEVGGLYVWCCYANEAKGPHSYTDGTRLTEADTLPDWYYEWKTYTGGQVLEKGDYVAYNERGNVEVRVTAPEGKVPCFIQSATYQKLREDFTWVYCV